MNELLSRFLKVTNKYDIGEIKPNYLLKGTFRSYVRYIDFNIELGIEFNIHIPNEVMNKLYQEKGTFKDSLNYVIKEYSNSLEKKNKSSLK